MAGATEFRLVEKKESLSNWGRIIRKGEKVCKLITLCVWMGWVKVREKLGKPMGEDLKYNIMTLIHFS